MGFGTELGLIAKDVMDQLDYERLSPDVQAEILKYKESINVDNMQSIMDVGTETCGKLAQFSKAMLSEFKVKDLPELATLIPSLNAAFAQVDTESLVPKKQGLFAKMFKQAKVDDLIQKFENVEQVVQGIQKQLERVHFEIQKDVINEQQMGQQNIEYIKRLDCAIFALKLVYKEELDKLKQEESKTNTDDILAVHVLQQRKDRLTQMDRQAYNLMTQRVQAIQILPILRTLIEGNNYLASNVYSAIHEGIPIWEQNFVIALQLQRQQGAVKIEAAVHEMTNNLIKSNNTMLKENAIAIAKAVNGGLIDLDTLEETNKALIETAKAVAEIANTATKARADGYVKMNGIVKELVESESGKMLASSIGDSKQSLTGG